MPRHGLGVSADPARLAQAIANLLTNAAKYTPPGGLILHQRRGDGGEVIVTVRDNGIGIAPEMLPRIFDLFTQDRQAIDRAQGGLGLGLAIVRSLVALHDGTVTAQQRRPLDTAASSWCGCRWCRLPVRSRTFMYDRSG